MSAISPTSVALTEPMVKLKTKTDRLSDVKSLNLWGQDLSDVSLLTQMCAVEVLSLSVNNISSLKDFSSCHKLQELYLRKNEIPDVSEVSHLANLQDLRVLWLSDNPCAQDPGYRAKVLQILPQLHKLDNDDVTAQAAVTLAAAGSTSADTSAAQPVQALTTEAQATEASRTESLAAATEPLSVSHQPSFQPENLAFINPSQLPTNAAPSSTQPVTSVPPSRSNVLYAVIALLTELDESSLHVVQAEVQQRLQAKK